MSLIKSISGIRGTIGGKYGDGFNPFSIASFVMAYVTLLKKIYENNSEKIKVIVGRDARESGAATNNIVVGTLVYLGIDVIDIGLTTTPTIEMEIKRKAASGGIMITASHNAAQWNALKLYTCKGEFISDTYMRYIITIICAQEKNSDFFEEFAFEEELGKYEKVNDAIENHIDEIIKLQLVDINAIKKANFKVVIDTINSTGSLALPPLLEKLGVKKENIITINAEANGNFAHNPEPLPENIKEICEVIKKEKADVGFVVDPDVDRLAIVMENGEVFGEEYTLVAVADYVLSNVDVGTNNYLPNINTVSNMSSSRALKMVAEKYGAAYFASAVGEVNVVEKMKEVSAVIGGEGNGGVIYPELHYGRDALVGIALFLSFLGIKKKQGINTVSELRASYPNLYISKNKIELKPDTNVDALLQKVMQKFKNIGEISNIDGVK
ncbi:MAG: phosphoglucosamine mutase, partial [Bacteroidales bacterium]|nr:phosphoglucosamine mutase [Bacteroidales bacterium]